MSLVETCIVLLVYGGKLAIFVATMYFLIAGARALKTMARAQQKQAAAMHEITDILNDTLCDGPNDGQESDMTRLVLAVEKIAGNKTPATPAPEAERT